jgi:hypothetical protein
MRFFRGGSAFYRVLGFFGFLLDFFFGFKFFRVRFGLFSGFGFFPGVRGVRVHPWVKNETRNRFCVSRVQVHVGEKNEPAPVRFKTHE